MADALPQPIVFLDIDGVLLPFGDDVADVPENHLFPDRCLAALSLLLAESGACIVLSSTWRAQPQYMQDIVNDFQRYAAAHGGPLGDINGFTRTTCPMTYSVRQLEIRTWLASGEDVGAWVALDDEPLLEGKACQKHRAQFEGHVVQTASHEGLTEEQAMRAVALLAKQRTQLSAASRGRRGRRAGVLGRRGGDRGGSGSGASPLGKRPRESGESLS